MYVIMARSGVGKALRIEYAFLRGQCLAHTARPKRELGFGVLRKLVEDNVLGFFSKSPLSAEHALGSFSFKLFVIEIRIVAVQGHQLLMGALLNNLAAPHHQD